MADLRPHGEPHPDVSGFVLGALDPDEARRFNDHLVACPACRQEVKQLAGIPALLADLPPAVAVPPEIEARTFARIAAAQSAGEACAPPPAPLGATPSGATAAGAATVSPAAPAPNATPPSATADPGAPTPGAGAEIVPLPSQRRSRARQIFLAAAAAIVVFAAGVGVATRVRGTEPAPAPVATIRLISATGGPAHGTATIRFTPAGLTIDMSVTALAPSPAGTIYTCWLVAGDDTINQPDRVSVGSFLVRAPNATVTVHWTTAADLARFPHLGITEELNNGNPAHRGPKVLVAP